MGVNITIDNCQDCPHHQNVPDPDPDDWFCDDDVAVICKLSLIKEFRSFVTITTYRKITVACRPHHLRQESMVPDWCPLRKK